MNQKKEKNYDEKIIIDEKKKLVFESEEAVLSHFAKDIDHFEALYDKAKHEGDYTDAEAEKMEALMDELLDAPDEVWKDEKSLKTSPFYVYVKKFEEGMKTYFYVAIVYVAEEVPTFIYLHFPTRFEEVVDHFRSGDQVYDRIISGIELGAIEGDALTEGDELSLGLFKAMSVLRGGEDIQPEEFHHFTELREETIEEPDEIWRTADLSGNMLVNFIKDFSMQDEELYYIAVTLEDESSSSHALLFSFPTNDDNLVDRYRMGENLQAEEVVQESSH